MIGVSSCLAGNNCTFKGSNHLIEKIKEMVENNQAIVICPEVLGGMTIPRDPCEIIDLDNLVVKSINGEDCSEQYLKGAYKALEILKKYNIEVVLLKAKSPSCGKGLIYDGSFKHRLIKGNGITTKILEENGILVYNEDRIEEFFKYIEKR